ncbi:pilus assembly protein PilM [Patescibacteria group bacterium]|nr:pilus assembly protein PilM [Patescibacteria group bacterium]
MNSFKKLLEQVNGFFQWMMLPKEPLVGLEFSDSSLRIGQIVKKSLKKEGFLLEPGIIQEGVVKDKGRLVAQLKTLKAQFAPERKEKLSVIAIIPPPRVYAQVFTLPKLNEAKEAEAIKLNLQSLTPTEYAQVYADWERLHEKDGNVEYLGAFARREVVDLYVDALQEAGFTTVAVEFPALALARAIRMFGVGVDAEQPYIVMNITNDGIDFMIYRYGNMYFDYFTPWHLMPSGDTAREISFDDFKATIYRELKKVSTFYANHWGGGLLNVALIAPAFQQETAQFIEDQFHYKVTQLSFRGYEAVPLSWAALIGAAYRATVNRASDIFISLMAIGTEDGYFYAQVMFLITFWRNVLLTAAMFFILMFVVVDSFLARTYVDIVQQVQGTTQLPTGVEVTQLAAQAKMFNALVTKTQYARQNSNVWSPFLEKINSVAQGVSFVRLQLDTTTRTGFIIAKAATQTDAIDFKNNLTKAGLQDIALPLAKIQQNIDGTISFTITFSA